MSRRGDPILVGIDGGGTSCRVAIIAGGARYEVKVGSANVATDRAAAVRTILSGLDSVAEAGGIDWAELAHGYAYAGLAGVIGPEDSDHVAEQLPVRSIRVEDDRPAAIVGALGDGNGTVAGIGTGSFYARQHDGELALIGGRGLKLGDEASGAWLGRGLLARTLHACDGLRAYSDLSRNILREYGGPSEIVRFGLAASPAEYAVLAPRIVDAAAAGDTTAVGLMQDGISFVEQSIRAVGWQPGETLCLIGGLAEKYATYLPQDMRAAMQEPRGNALDGALSLAQRLSAEGREA